MYFANEDWPDDIYKGFNWDVWKELQEKLSDRYHFDLFESEVTKNYDSFVEKIKNKDLLNISISQFDKNFELDMKNHIH